MLQPDSSVLIIVLLQFYEQKQINISQLGSTKHRLQLDLKLAVWLVNIVHCTSLLNPLSLANTRLITLIDRAGHSEEIRNAR